jgi:hypothetical protein
LVGTSVENPAGEKLGKIEDLMIDLQNGRVAYAVLSFGGFLGMGEKLFAVPFSALTCDCEDEKFILPTDKDRLKNAPGFDKDHWPDTADRTWGAGIHTHYGVDPYWNQA